MDCERKCFTVTWRIENYNFCLLSPENGLETPAFYIDSLKETSWKFRIEPKLINGHILFFCKKNAEGRDTVSGSDIEISIFYDGDSSPAFEKLFTNSAMTLDMLFLCHVPHNNIYIRKENEFSAPKTFTIRCRMYETGESSLEAGHCFIKTRMRVVRTAFIGLVEDFSSISPRDKKTLVIKSAAAEIQSFSPVISLAGDRDGYERVWIEVVPFKKDQTKLCVCKLFLLDSKGVKKICARSEILFDKNQPQEWKFPLSFTKDYLMREKTQFLANDSLTLKCEFAYTTGAEYELIEDSEYGLPLVTKNPLELPSAMKELSRLYEEGILCDTKLQTETKTFNVHKSILSARSPEFQNMFTTGMTEEANDCVPIENLKADTVHRMLGFLYSDNVDDLDWESANSLYVAADKYNITGLKHICSIFLKNSLQPSNCFEVLLLADKHADDYLKDIVHQFIACYREEIFHSSQWAEFEDKYRELALKVYRSVFMSN